MSQPDESIRSSTVIDIWKAQRRFAEGGKADLLSKVPQLTLSPDSPAILSASNVAAIAAFLRDSGTDTITRERVLAIVHGRAALPPVLLAEAARSRLARQCEGVEAQHTELGGLFQGVGAWQGLKPESFVSPLLGLGDANDGESPRLALLLARELSRSGDPRLDSLPRMFLHVGSTDVLGEPDRLHCHFATGLAPLNAIAMAQRAGHNGFPSLVSAFPAVELGETHGLGAFHKDALAQLAAVYLRHGQVGASPPALTFSADASILPLLEVHLETLNGYAQDQGCVTAQLTLLPPELLRSAADRPGARRSALPSPGSLGSQLSVGKSPRRR